MRFYRWDQCATSPETDAVLWEVVEVLLPRISDCEASAEISVLVRNRDIRGICNLSVDYTTLSCHDASVIRQISAFFSKRSDLDLGYDRRRVAIDTYLMAERLCFETNSLLRMRESGGFCLPPDVELVFHDVRRKVSLILGDCPDLRSLTFRFGPGATTTLPRRMASPRAKLSDKLTCSEDLYPFVEILREEMPHFLCEESGDPRDVAIGPARLDFVPKTAKTDRAIAVEPVLNQMVQLGIGDYIAKRLRRVGVDIRDQTRNQRAAREGSLSGASATLDLSSASDTISSRLVFELLPPDWFDLLDSCRSKELQYQDFKFIPEKFCSMGNGFTFPLETLIFYCIACACADHSVYRGEVCCYGDDLIVPVGSYDRLCSVLTSLGFLVNGSKSFSSGPFRESCGCDYFSGIDIRPLYIKGPLHGFDIFRLFNFFEEKEDSEVCATILRHIDPTLRVYGPRGYGCGHLNGVTPYRSYNRKVGWSGYLFDTFTFRNREDYRARKYDRVLPLYSTYIREDVGEAVRLTPDGFVVTEPLWALHSKDGVLGTTVPGTKGYNRISIYTLEKV